MDIRVRPTQEFAEAAAALLADRLRDCRTFGLAGGSTPSSAYRELRNHDLDWNDLHIWVGDERWVAPDDPECNSLMAKQTLCDGLNTNLYRLPWAEEADPGEAAQQYEQTLHEVFSPSGGKPDLVLLGLGTDGHTASLFPGTDALNEEERDYVANWVPQQDSWRLTATFPLLTRASTLVILASGAAKADAVRMVVSPAPNDPVVPARTLVERKPDTILLLDEDAAQRIR